MAPLIEDRSRLTQRYQTTVPNSVRKALGLDKGDTLHYRVESDGRVYLAKAQDEDLGGDPAINAFLDFLQSDMTTNPHRIRAVDNALHERVAPLVNGLDIDLDAPLSPDDE